MHWHSSFRLCKVGQVKLVNSVRVLMYDVPPSNTSYNHHSQAAEHLPDQLCTILRVLFMPKCFALNSRRPFTRTLFSTLSTVRPPTSDRCMPALTRMHRYTPTPIRWSTGAIAIRCRCDARRPSLHRGCIGWQGHRLTHESVSSHVCALMRTCSTTRLRY